MSQYLQVQIRPWNLNDSDFVMDGSQPLDPRKTIFVGGVPRPLRAGSYMYVFWEVISLPAPRKQWTEVTSTLVNSTGRLVFCYSGAGHDHGPSVWGGVLRWH